MRLALFFLLTAAASAQPNLNGTWSAYRGGPNTDPKLAAPPAAPLMLKAP